MRSQPSPEPTRRGVIGVDVGTSGVKVVLVDDAGLVLDYQEHPVSVAHPRPGMHEHDAEMAWWQVPAMLIGQLRARNAEVEVLAVGLSCCGPCIVPLGAGHALRPGILYGVDTRAQQQIAEVSESTVAAGLVNRLSSQSIAPKLEWIRRHEPDVFAATDLVLTANSYLAFRLTGEAAIDQHQAAYFEPWWRDHAWDTTVAGAWAARLPRLLWGDEIVGIVRPAAAELTGLTPGIPVVLGSSDGLTDSLGAGAWQPGQGVVRYGSTLGVTVFAPAASVVPGLWNTPGITEGTAVVVGGLSAAGSITTWFRERFAQELPQSDAGSIVAAHEVLTEEASNSPPGAHGLITLPYFSGERTPFYDPDARGVVLGLSLGHTRGDLYRSILEGTALGARQLLEVMSTAEVLGDEPLRAVGGGTRRGLWTQILSDVTGLPQVIVEPAIGAPLGAARLAADAVGTVPLSAAAAADQGRQVIPDPSHRGIYDDLYASFGSLYGATRRFIRPNEEAPCVP
ncbi:MAG: FGGY-family carbohydrate kinase [Beutenbergiaceae bacterium]